MDSAARQQWVEKDSKYADSFEPFELGRIGQGAMGRLERLGVTRRYDIHSDKGRVAAFLEIVHALRERRLDRANFWIANLAHSTADMPALNHDPLGHVATYALAEQEWGLTTVSGKPLRQIRPLLDLDWAASQPEGARRLADRVEQMRLRDDGRSLRETLVEIMLAGYDGAAFLAPRGARAVSAAVDVLEKEQATGPRETLFDVMADLGAWAVVRILRDVDVAVRLAGSDVELEFDDEVSRLYAAAVDEHLRQPRLDDALYVPLLERQVAPTEPAVLVAVEPLWRMNEAFLGFSERVWGAAIMHTLLEEKIASRLVDIRTLLDAGFPSPRIAPVVVLPARRIADFGWMKGADLSRHLQGYLAAGGKVLWIGGAPPPKDALPEIANAMQMVPSNDKKWPCPLSEFLDSRVAWLGEGRAAWSFVRSPVTKAGWQVPVCPYVFTASAQLEPLLQLQLRDGQVLTVGAAWPAEKPSAIFLPTYAITPFILTAADIDPSPAQPTLDAAGRQMLLGCLQRLSFSSFRRSAPSR